MRRWLICQLLRWEAILPYLGSLLVLLLSFPPLLIGYYLSAQLNEATRSGRLLELALILFSPLLWLAMILLAASRLPRLLRFLDHARAHHDCRSSVARMEELL